MQNKFSGEEIVELGVLIEENGHAFYRGLAAKAKSPKARDAFGYLAEQEEAHIRTFAQILEKFKRNKPAEMLSDDYYAYMHSLADTYVFTRKDEGVRLAQEISSEAEAIDLGIGFEKDSILFYDGMKQVVEPSERQVINELIAQEKKHLRDLYALKNGI
jgi:rubrerythrin